MVAEADAYWAWFHNKLVGPDPQRPRLSAKQVQVLFFKNSLSARNGELPPAQHMAIFKTLLAAFTARAKLELPNLKQYYITSAIYSGYASKPIPRTEPNAWHEGVAVREYILANLPNDPWLAWGPYLWADGVLPRSDDLVWLCNNFATDGVHPATSGQIKVANLLLKFIESMPTVNWL